MEKKYEIIEKQLVFLNGFLLRKYPSISDETRIELTDHLILDFEATTENGNLSQYLSNELGFIRKFVFNGVRKVKKTYRMETWSQFFSFFTDFKLLPITIFISLLFYFLNENLNNKIACLSIFILSSILFLVSIRKGMINKKALKHLGEVKFLGTEIWLPFFLVQLLAEKHIGEFITSNSYLFTVYSTFIIMYGLAALLILRKHKKIILEKYKHLLN
ncbi:hypothetical protein [Polaribacter sp. IC073]|uniref:hypothetical protein n=1 Tax=Polaribacter sp. IC073 TaxID=2508540 RepID=UPI0011BF8B1D|nr:hypothetical protein [Polaribacter sp. IC073]TXD49923.1 hypothetical protein ES045_01710 [Polaribacter sp. IC073]